MRSGDFDIAKNFCLNSKAVSAKEKVYAEITTGMATSNKTGAENYQRVGVLDELLHPGRASLLHLVGDMTVCVQSKGHCAHGEDMSAGLLTDGLRKPD